MGSATPNASTQRGSSAGRPPAWRRLICRARADAWPAYGNTYRPPSCTHRRPCVPCPAPPQESCRTGPVGSRHLRIISVSCKSAAGRMTPFRSHRLDASRGLCNDRGRQPRPPRRLPGSHPGLFQGQGSAVPVRPRGIAGRLPAAQERRPSLASSPRPREPCSPPRARSDATAARPESDGGVARRTRRRKRIRRRHAERSMMSDRTGA